MKLRNKKTGEIIEYSISLNQWSEDVQEWYLFGNYDSIDELKEEWEDYKPTEPLIKDPKIRNAVRAWAEANGLAGDYAVKYCSISFTLTSWKADIEFNRNIEDLEEGKEYTITELCGDDEE